MERDIEGERRASRREFDDLTNAKAQAELYKTAHETSTVNKLKKIAKKTLHITKAIKDYESERSTIALRG